MTARSAFALPLLALALTAEAGDFPLWEAGVGVSALSIPDYRGSDQSSAWVLPIPYLLYRGDTVRIDRQSVRTIFFEGQRAELDMSFAAAPPVNSDDNEARAGMPDLDPTFEAGLSWKYSLWQADSGNRRLRLVLPLRGVVTSDFRSARWAGWITTPGIKFDRGIVRSDEWKLGAMLNLHWANARHNSYFYSVGEAWATAERPAYAAQGGYAGATVVVSATRRVSRWWLGGFLRYDNLDGATFADSPLVRARENWWGGIALSRVFWQSDQRVERDD